jgi:Predicted pPIWI-associating nuclease
VHYAVHAGLPIDFVRDELHVDVEKTATEFSTLVNSFSKYTHLGEKTFDTEDADAGDFAENALEVFRSLFETIEDCRASTQRAFESYAQDAVTDMLFDNVHAELDELSTHTSVSQVLVEQVQIEELDSKKVTISVSGSVDCQLQYGSDMDYGKGDGVRSMDSFPFRCEYKADASVPNDLTLVAGSLHIDNSSFYEGQEDDAD